MALARTPMTHGFMNGSLSSSSPRTVNGPPETASYTLFPLKRTAWCNVDQGKTSVRVCDHGRNVIDGTRNSFLFFTLCKIRPSISRNDGLRESKYSATRHKYNGFPGTTISFTGSRQVSRLFVTVYTYVLYRNIRSPCCLLWIDSKFLLRLGAELSSAKGFAVSLSVFLPLFIPPSLPYPRAVPVSRDSWFSPCFLSVSVWPFVICDS